MQFKINPCVAAFLMLSACAAQASQDWAVKLGVDIRQFDWREYDDTGQLLKESGPLLGAAAELQYNEGHNFFRFRHKLHVGTVLYDGQLQSGTPYQADANEISLDNEIQIGRFNVLEKREREAEVRMTVMHRFWHRYIEGSVTQNVSSAEEQYQWLMLLMGGALPLSETVRVYADIGGKVFSTQKVYSKAFGNFDLQPGNGAFLRLGMRLDYKYWNIDVYGQHQDIARSNYAIRTNVFDGLNYFLYQPESTRTELGITVLKRVDW